MVTAIANAQNVRPTEETREDFGDRLALVQLAGLFGWIPAERCGPNVWHKKGIGFEITEDLPERIDRERRVPPLQPTSSTQLAEERASAEKRLLEEICEILKCPKDAEALLSAVRQGVPNIDTQRLRIAWEAGAKLGHSYADNFTYFTGEQKERQWRKFLEGFEAIDKAMGVPSPEPK